MLAAHSQGRAAIWSAPNDTSGQLALRHGFDTIPHGFSRQYTWSDPQHGAELATRLEGRISIWSSVSLTCQVL